VTPTEAIAACSSLKAQLESGRAELNACRRAARFVRKRALDEFTRTGVGRSVFGVKAVRGKAKSRGKALRLVVPGPRVVADATGCTVTAKVQGIAALVEKGGQTKPHEIRGALGPKIRRLSFGPRGGAHWQTNASKRQVVGTLGFMGKGGHVITPKTVRHPGSRFRKDDFYSRAWNAAIPAFKAEIEKGLQELVQKFPSRY
jgi:hypothetical protein